MTHTYQVSIPDLQYSIMHAGSAPYTFHMHAIVIKLPKSSNPRHPPDTPPRALTQQLDFTLCL